MSLMKNIELQASELLDLIRDDILCEYNPKPASSEEVKFYNDCQFLVGALEKFLGIEHAEYHPYKCEKCGTEITDDDAIISGLCDECEEEEYVAYMERMSDIECR